MILANSERSVWNQIRSDPTTAKVVKVRASDKLMEAPCPVKTGSAVLDGLEAVVTFDVGWAVDAIGGGVAAAGLCDEGEFGEAAEVGMTVEVIATVWTEELAPPVGLLPTL